MPANSKRISRPSWLLFLSGMLILWAFTAWPHLEKAEAQDQATVTPSPTIQINEPDLIPRFSEAGYPEGWLQVIEKSGFRVYLAPNLGERGDRELVGEWIPQLGEAAYYQVEAYLPISEIGEFRATQAESEAVLPTLSRSVYYLIRHADGETRVTIDQAQRDSGWVDLGTYFFAASSDSLVSLNNITGEPEDSHLVAFSALRLTQRAAPNATATTMVIATPTATATMMATATTSSTPISAQPSSTPTTAPSLTAIAASPVAATAAPSPTVAPAAEQPELDFSIVTSDTVDGVVSESREIFLDGTPVGQLGLSYPLEMRPGQRKNIIVDLEASGVFTSTLITVINRTLDQPLEEEAFVISPIFEVGLKGPFDFTKLNEPPAKRMEVPQGETSWNVEPQANTLPGEAELSIEVSVRSNFAPDEYIPRRVIPFRTRIQSAAADGLPGWLWWLVLLLLLLLALLLYWQRRRDGPWSRLAPPSWAALNKGLLAILRQRFLDEAEFAELCFQLDQPYADLAGRTLSARMRDLVQRMERHGRLPQLLAAMDEADALDHLEWQPIQEPLLRLLVVRLNDAQFQSRFAPDFSDSAFAGYIRSLAQQLSTEDSNAANRWLALLQDDTTAGDEERQLLRELRQSTQGSAGETNVPQLAAAMAAADRA